MQQWHTERQRSGYLITTSSVWQWQFKRSDKCINHQVIQPWSPNTKENFIPGIGFRVREILGIMKKRATAYTKLSYPVNLLTNNSICNWVLLVGVIIFIIRVWVTCIVSWNLREVRKRKCLTPKMWKPLNEINSNKLYWWIPGRFMPTLKAEDLNLDALSIHCFPYIKDNIRK